MTFILIVLCFLFVQCQSIELQDLEGCENEKNTFVSQFFKVYLQSILAMF
jgi:hypothetical protein